MWPNFPARNVETIKEINFSGKLEAILMKATSSHKITQQPSLSLEHVNS